MILNLITFYDQACSYVGAIANIQSRELFIPKIKTKIETYSLISSMNQQTQREERRLGHQYIKITL